MVGTVSRRDGARAVEHWCACHRLRWKHTPCPARFQRPRKPQGAPPPHRIGFPPGARLPATPTRAGNSAIWRSPAPEATRGEWFAGSGETASLGRARRGGLRGNGYLYDAAPYVTERPEGGSSNALRIHAPSSSVIVGSSATSGTPARGRLAVRCTRDSNAIESAILLMWKRNRSMFVPGVSPPASSGG
jgi:hypothetical protein